jgi:hypothetical protein
VKQVGEGVVILTYEPIPDPDRAQGAAATVAAEAE